MAQSEIDSTTVRSIAFAATCSLALFTHDTDKPVALSNSASAGTVPNVILWMDNRATVEAEYVNKKGDTLLNYLGGAVSGLMELPKVLWLKNNQQEEVFDACAFYDLNDALTYIATENARPQCTAVCENEILPLGVDGTIKGWNREFLADLGLESLAENEFRRIGGVCKVSFIPA